MPNLTLHANTAADLMTPGPVSLAASVTVAEAAAFLTERGFGAATVINAGGRPVGVVTKTDIVNHARHHGTSPADTTPVTQIMTPAVFTVRVEMSAASVIEQLLEVGVHHLFVIDPSGIVVGIISPIDVLRKLK
ncbi:CBS domain-containing protein [Gemmata sp. JC673]|uniref:CBS domain-containing protein n=1 Tax=Gemmata algarum TaxID=2975278 RepID=A0ABU5EW97_9BACT|nr:CBS domain-containing protein [Gemmata algarum]MDY3557894.1 CBS domain-containing protein [Gemmata algarum]